jgi:hypothetical protein
MPWKILPLIETWQATTALGQAMSRAEVKLLAAI